MSWRSRVLAALVALTPLFTPAANADTDFVVTLERARAAVFGTDENFVLPVTQSYVLVTGEPEFTEPPTGIVVVFPGGSGKIRIDEGTLPLNTNNFVVRTRHLMAARGFVVAVLDAASDIQTIPGGLRGLRRTKAVLSDVEVVVADLSARYPGLPIWLHGTSRGAIGAAAYAAAAVAAENEADGLVLSAPVTVTSSAPNEQIADVQLGAIKVPTLLIGHVDDGCFVTPPGDLDGLAETLVNAPKVRVKLFDGGTETLANPCRALSAHGFIGIEPRVVRHVARFIRRNTD